MGGGPWAFTGFIYEGGDPIKQFKTIFIEEELGEHPLSLIGAGPGHPVVSA